MKKLLSSIFIVWLLFSIFSVLYTTGLFRKVNNKVIGYVNTGLVNSPGGQVAFQAVAKADNQFAIAITGGMQPQVAEKNPSLAMAVRESGGMPTQLFDIHLELDQSVVSNAGDIGLRVIFTSFGKVATPVEMTFDILNSAEKIIHSEKNTTIVETEKVYNKKISNFTLIPGNYTIRLTTVYNKNVKDEFRQPFKIVLVKSRYILPLFWLIVLILASLMIVSVMIFSDKIFKKNR